MSLTALTATAQAWANKEVPSAQFEIQETVYKFDIPSQSLSKAITAFSKVTGLQILYLEQAPFSETSPAVKGTYRVVEVLDRLLAGSSLKYRFTSENSLTLELKNNQNQEHSENVTEDILVIGTNQSRYDSRYSQTGTLIAKDVTEIARSVEIIPEQLLLDTHAQELEDVYRMSPNVVNMDGYGGSREDFLIRGFRRRDDIYRNSVRLKTNGRINPDTVESVQIIKGPVAEIGQMTPGGLVNIVTKKPSYKRESSVVTNFNEHGQRQVKAETTGPLDDQEKLAYRVTASLENSRNFRDAEIDRQFLASSMSWLGDEGTTIDFNYEYTHDERPIDRGLATVPTGGSTIANVSQSTRLDQANLNNRDATTHIWEIDSSVPVFNEDWYLENKLFYAYEQVDEIRNEIVNVSDTGVLTRRVQGNDDRELSTAFGRMQLRGKADVGLPLDLASGVEVRHQYETWTNFAGTNQTGGTVWDPSSFTLVNNTQSSPLLRVYTEVEQLSYGPYAQGDLHLADNLTLTLGARYEVYDNEYNSDNKLTGALSGIDPERDSKLTKSAGIVWKPVDVLSLYASYAETFQSQNIYSGNSSTAVFSPEEGRQFEVGAKWSGWNDRLLLTGAIFDIEQENVVETVNGTPTMTGGIRSRGGESSIVVNPVKGFNLRASAGFLSAKIVSENDNDGNRPANTPATTASLWASYEFQEAASPLQGLGLGAGLSYVGNRYGNNSHSFELGDYSLLDVGLWYYLPIQNNSRVRFDLGMKNVTDEEYFVASGNDRRISVGAPRTVFGSVRVEF